MKKILRDWKYFLKEDTGKFEDKAFQLFIPRCGNDKKCSLTHFLENPPALISQKFMGMKPRGGLWTSTARLVERGADITNSSFTSDWLEWSLIHYPEYYNQNAILLLPQTNNIFHIENEEDVDGLEELFPLQTNGDERMTYLLSVMNGRKIDFVKALGDEGYAGIHWGMKDGGKSESWFGKDGNWDVESTCWRPDAIKKGFLRPIGIGRTADNI